MSDDPLDLPAADAWRRSRCTAPAPDGFVARVLAARAAAAVAPLPRTRWLRLAALTAGGAWFVARLAGLFLVFSAA